MLSRAVGADPCPARPGPAARHDDAVDLADVAALARPDVAAALAEAAAGAGRTDPLRLVTTLRADGLDPAAARAVVTQVELRRRAREKFGADAGLMTFTRDGYEQATRRPVAEHRAARLAAAGTQVLADLGCGIGGDSIAAARAGIRVIAVERDPVTAAVARANVAALGLSDLVTVHVGDAVQAVRDDVIDAADAVFLDPARRNARGRVFDPDAYEPPFTFVAELADRFPALVVKVAPGIPRDLGGAGVEAEWVSHAGDVKEAALWHGRLATAGVLARATLLPAAATVTDAEPSVTKVRPPGRWLHEPDGAVVRAGLVGQAAAAVGGGLIDATIAYVTTDEDTESALTRRFEVLASQPFGLKPLRARLRELAADDVVVKKRGSAIDPVELRRRLRLDRTGHGARLTVVLTRVEGRPWAFVCR